MHARLPSLLRCRAIDERYAIYLPTLPAYAVTMPL